MSTDRHDGSSSYHLMAGVYRLVCSNGLVVGNSFAEARVRHTKHAPEGIVGASFRIIESLPSISESVNEMRSVKLELYERQALASAALTLRYPDQAPIQPEQWLRARRLWITRATCRPV